MKKLTRNAKLFIFTFVFILFVVGGIILVQILNPSKEETPTTNKKDDYSIVLVAQDQKITSTYLDSISKEKGSSTYKNCEINIKKGTKIKDYILSQNQSFVKYIQLIGPDGKEKISKKSKQNVSHYAYSMVLTGDIAEKTNKETKKKTYEIINARVTYDRIPFVLYANENTVCLSNKAKTKEKIVNFQEFTDSLQDLKKREKMVSW